MRCARNAQHPLGKRDRRVSWSRLSIGPRLRRLLSWTETPRGMSPFAAIISGLATLARKGEEKMQYNNSARAHVDALGRLNPSAARAKIAATEGRIASGACPTLAEGTSVRVNKPGSSNDGAVGSIVRIAPSGRYPGRVVYTILLPGTGERDYMDAQITSLGGA